MSYRLGTRSVGNLVGVHEDLQHVVYLAITTTKVDFTVIEGLRDRARQRELVDIGASQTMNSPHLTGHAIDVVPWVGGKVRWDWPLFYPIADAMIAAAIELDIRIRWGGDWNSDGIFNERFRDGPHFELLRSEYPD